MMAAFTAWANKKQKAERGAGREALGNRASYKAKMKKLKEEWDALPERLQVDPVVDNDDCAGGATYEDRLGTKLWGCSSSHSPIAEHLVEQFVNEVAPASDGKTTGLTASLASLMARAIMLVMPDPLCPVPLPDCEFEAWPRDWLMPDCDCPDVDRRAKL